MNTWLKQYMFSGLILGLNASLSIAADSVVYEFAGGTVTVTPRDTQMTPRPRKVVPADQSSALDATAIEINPLRRNVKVIPVSFSQDTAAPPKPMPDTVEPPQKPELVVPGATNSLPPLEPNSAPLTVVPPKPSCCDEPVITPRPSNALPPRAATTVPLAQMYRDVYNSIPFSRVEFNHYPNYRHDATMEFLFNQMRTTIMNRNTASSVNYDYYGSGWGYMGYPYYDPPAYPFSYGLRIHRSR